MNPVPPVTSTFDMDSSSGQTCGGFSASAAETSGGLSGSQSQGIIDGMDDQAPGTYGTQRKAAARNRVAIIEAAHELFAENPLVTLSEVAKRAGVGAGTLYRHFPTREDLILAAYQHDIERLTTAADEVLARHSSAKVAFVEWFETLSAY